MRPSHANARAAAARTLALPVAALLVAVCAGFGTAMVASLVGYRAAYYVAVFTLIGVAGMVAATRKEPLRFAFLALIACFPLAAAEVPPGRIGVTVFDAVAMALALGLIGRRMLASGPAAEPLFPSKSMLVAWLLCIPCVAFSEFPLLSLQIFAMNFGVFAFFLLAIAEMKREHGFERLALLFSGVTLCMAIGLFIDHFLHLNLSLRGSNLNQLSYVSGMEVWRAGGFFQDPQKAGAFLACMITFLLLLCIRGRFRDLRMRVAAWAAILVGLAALLTTVSRSAILACLSVSAVALFAFNRWNIAAKLAAAAGIAVIALVAALVPAETWLSMVPAAVTERFLQSRSGFEDRYFIWLDTWNIFVDHPLAGIGLGSFQSHLAESRPGVLNYYGIGEAEGVVYIPDQPESGYLKVLYEGGLAGALAALLVAGDAVRRAIGVAAAGHADPQARTECIAALAALAAFAVTFVTLFTVSDGRIAGIFAFFLAVIWHRSLQAAQAGTGS